MSSQRIAISGSEPLEAVQATASPANGVAVIAAPHPLYGGSLDVPVVEALAEGMLARGVSALRFNYRGVGQSAGQLTDDVSRAVEDFARVLEHTRASSPQGKRIACGYSFGAATAIELALRGDQALDALVLVAPPNTMVDRARLSALTLPVHVLVGDSDSYLSVSDAEAMAACMPVCSLTICAADHFFADELDDVLRFASSAVA